MLSVFSFSFSFLSFVMEGEGKYYIGLCQCCLIRELNPDAFERNERIWPTFPLWSTPCALSVFSILEGSLSSTCLRDLKNGQRDLYKDILSTCEILRIIQSNGV
ncbi:unnamed protein product [Prunus armeniaca]